MYPLKNKRSTEPQALASGSLQKARRPGAVLLREFGQQLPGLRHLPAMPCAQQAEAVSGGASGQSSQCGFFGGPRSRWVRFGESKLLGGYDEMYFFPKTDLGTFLFFGSQGPNVDRAQMNKPILFKRGVWAPPMVMNPH